MFIFLLFILYVFFLYICFHNGKSHQRLNLFNVIFYLTSLECFSVHIVYLPLLRYHTSTCHQHSHLRNHSSYFLHGYQIRHSVLIEKPMFYIRIVSFLCLHFESWWLHICFSSTLNNVI